MLRFSRSTIWDATCTLLDGFNRACELYFASTAFTIINYWPQRLCLNSRTSSVLAPTSLRKEAAVQQPLQVFVMRATSSQADVKVSDVISFMCDCEEES
uniref:Uncharacterized protein n=1 Tax=Peronospora matthiolae TaxID=2874970 RepID=A0AAV1UXI0_9STRA